MYRVSRNVKPKTQAVIVRNSDDIHFDNAKVFSQTRLAFDNAVLDETSSIAVRSRFFTHFSVQKGMKAAAPLPMPSVFAKNAKLEKLATGFSNASGHDHARRKPIPYRRRHAQDLPLERPLPAQPF